MASLDAKHPDIEKFIHFKSSLNHRNSRIVAEYDRNLKNSGRGQLKDTKYESVLVKTLQDDQLTHFNVSVLLSDEFMIAVRDNKDWNLVSPSNGKVVKTLKARDLLKQMAEQAWESGDPGILMEDAMNRENMVDYLERIRATNP